MIEFFVMRLYELVRKRIAKSKSTFRKWRIYEEFEVKIGFNTEYYLKYYIRYNKSHQNAYSITWDDCL